MSRRRTIAAGVVIALTTVLVGTALALSSISFITGTTASYDFGGFGPGYPVPGTVQIQAFTMAPGESIPWHFHKATSYVVLARGTLTEQHVAGPNQCDVEEFAAGAPEGANATRVAAHFAKLDADGDGSLTLEEFTAKPARGGHPGHHGGKR